MDSPVAAPRHAPDVERRTVWGHWPILMSISLAMMSAIPLLGLMNSGQDAGQIAAAHAGARNALLRLIPIAVLIGMSALIATRLANGWQKQLALWSSLVAVLVVAFAAR